MELSGQMQVLAAFPPTKDPRYPLNIASSRQTAGTGVLEIRKPLIPAGFPDRSIVTISATQFHLFNLYTTTTTTATTTTTTTYSLTNLLHGAESFLRS